MQYNDASTVLGNSGKRQRLWGVEAQAQNINLIFQLKTKALKVFMKYLQKLKTHLGFKAMHHGVCQANA